MDNQVATARVGALIQARMGSTRLPNKALLPLPLGATSSVLEHIVARARRATSLHTVVLTTTTLPADDLLAATADKHNLSIFRGDSADVLGRFQAAAATHDLQVVVRLTGDNPAIDPQYLDMAVQHHQLAGADYTLTTGLPLGTNLEIIGRSALEQAAAQAQQPEEREHVTPYLRRHPERFHLQTIPLSVPGAPATTRLTLDYPSDYALLQVLYTTLPQDFGLRAVGELLQQHPWLEHINSGNQQIQV